MLTRSTNSESVGNLLTGTIIVASAFLLYASFAMPQSGQSAQASVSAAAPAIEQVVVTAPGHLS